MRPDKAQADGTIRRPILWTSPCGKFVVVAGPFPRNFPRTIDATSVAIAATRQTTGDYGIMGRAETTRSNPAKTLRRLIEDPANEWGELAP